MMYLKTKEKHTHERVCWLAWHTDGNNNRKIICPCLNGVSVAVELWDTATH